MTALLEPLGWVVAVVLMVFLGLGVIVRAD